MSDEESTNEDSINEERSDEESTATKTSTKKAAMEKATTKKTGTKKTATKKAATKIDGENSNEDLGVDEITRRVESDLKISKEPQRTPKQTGELGERDRASTKPRKKLNFDYSLPSTSSQIEAGASSTKEGKWLEKHPWDGEKPDLNNLKMASTISASQVYGVGEEYKTGNKVNLRKIYSDLPNFLMKMEGSTSREDLDFLLGSTLYQMNLTEANTRPHIREIVDKKRCIEPKDKPSLRAESDAKFKAFSLPNNEANQLNPSQQNYWYLDCEYMLKMWLPQLSKGWFKCKEGNRITETDDDKKNSRWIFTPSYRRAKIALLDWPEDKPENKIVTQDSTIRILVVRSSEFDDYVKYCGYKFPVISLPRDEIGAGYPRLWIQKIGLRLNLDVIWMIDDSVKWFCEYHPTEKPDPKESNSSSSQGVYSERRRPFGEVLTRIEKFVKDAQDEKPPIAAMSPKRFFVKYCEVGQAFVCKPPQCAVFLNLKVLKSRNVFYRPQLKTFEDMMFGYECDKNGLKVIVYNRIHLWDHQWKDTGARSSYVQGNPTTAAASP